MTGMKRIFALFLLFPLALSALFFPSARGVKAVKAETSYAYIPNANVAFYSDSEEAARLLLFYLPESYFVCILGETDGYYRVSYLEDAGDAKKLTGFVKKSSVIPVTFTPETPYLYKKIEVTYYASGNADLSGDILSRITVTCIYYGDYTENGKTYCYVLRGDRFGYVERPMGFTFPKNAEYAEKTVTEQPSPDAPEEEAKGMSPAQIVFLVLLCLLIPTLAALILRPSRKKNFPDDDSLN
ncbi:MAG: hypothetical protein SPH68_03540 [Candidatus Borkfalkiaceae bacterium]|nr:hypothetical protein [Clostridia bacterium]MDY6223219.1 hypothetical protein [Christensenellaceae bacterium]